MQNLTQNQGLIDRTNYQVICSGISCGHPIIAILSNYALIRGSDMLVSSLIIPYQMNENFNFHFFDRGVII